MTQEYQWLQPLEPEDKLRLFVEELISELVEEELSGPLLTLKRLLTAYDELASIQEAQRQSMTRVISALSILHKEGEYKDEQIRSLQKTNSQLQSELLEIASELEHLKASGATLTFIVGGDNYSFGPIGDLG